MTSIIERLNDLDTQKQKLLKQLNRVRSARTFKCVCGKSHRIKDCIAIQTHRYVQPSGCTGGDYWKAGELHIICPSTERRNRVYISNISVVSYDKRSYYNHNPEMQFSQMYGHLFKTIVQEYNNNSRGEVNDYFSKNLKKFELSFNV